jgi:hypothetical protein
MVTSLLSKIGRDACLRRIQDTKIRLAKLVDEEPGNRPLRKRLAPACMQLAEISRSEPSVGQPSSLWQEAHDHYMMLARAKPDDILAQLVLGDCSRRRIRGQSPDSSYSEAVRILEQGGQGLTALLKQNPALDWLREALLEDYCELVFCHSRVGRNAEAARIVNNDVQPLIARLVGNPPNAKYGSSATPGREFCHLPDFPRVRRASVAS